VPFLDKLIDMAKDPKNQERVKSAIQNQTAKRKHTRPHSHGGHHAGTDFDDIFGEEEYEQEEYDEE
jgi:hypothetical protein